LMVRKIDNSFNSFFVCPTIPSARVCVRPALLSHLRKGIKHATAC
jgi:hypothetical protein